MIAKKTSSPHITRRSFLKKTMATSIALSCPVFMRPAVAQSQNILLGGILPFSGGLELFAEQAKLGIALAVREINQQGGILGRKIKMLYQDNQANPRKTVEIAQKLIGRDRVSALLGPITSHARNALDTTLTKSKTPLLYATNYEGGACNRYLFSFNTTPNQELGKLLPYLEQQKKGSYYLFGADYIWPQAMFEKAEQLIDGFNGQVAGKEFTPWGVTDFTPTLRKIEQSGATKFLFALPGADGITFIKQAASFGLTKKITIGFLGFSEAYLSAFTPQQIEQIFVALPFVESSQEAGTRNFVARLKKAFGDDITISHYVMTHYNALYALRAGMEKADSIESEKFIPAMEGLTIPTPTGDILIQSKDHHVTMAMYLATTRKGELHTVKSLGKLAPDAGCA